MIARVCVFKRREEESRETLKFVTLFSIKITFPRGEESLTSPAVQKLLPKVTFCGKHLNIKLVYYMDPRGVICATVMRIALPHKERGC